MSEELKRDDRLSEVAKIAVEKLKEEFPDGLTVYEVENFSAKILAKLKSGKVML